MDPNTSASTDSCHSQNGIAPRYYFGSQPHWIHMLQWIQMINPQVFFLFKNLMPLMMTMTMIGMDLFVLETRSILTNTVKISYETQMPKCINLVGHAKGPSWPFNRIQHSLLCLWCYIRCHSALPKQQLYCLPLRDVKHQDRVDRLLCQ